MTAENDSAREDFERWVKSTPSVPIHLDTFTHEDGFGSTEYRYGNTRDAYQAWQASRERYVQCITDLERRNGELETLALHVSRCRECAETSVMHCDNARPLWELAMTRTKEQK